MILFISDSIIAAIRAKQADENLQNAAKESYSFRRFSDIVKLIDHYLPLVIEIFWQISCI